MAFRAPVTAERAWPSSMGRVTGAALASNSAHIAAMFIAFMTILVAAGAPVIPTAIILAILCNSASFLTHYGCGVTPIFFGTGFMGQGEWWKIGFIITVMHIVVWMVLGLPIMGILGMM